MDIQVGNIARGSVAVTGSGGLYATRSTVRNSNEATREGNTRYPMFPEDRADIPQVGFGDGTVSIPGMAVETVRRGVTYARQIVPTVEEARERVQGRIAEQRDREEQARTERTDERKPREVPRTYLRMPDAAADARVFINRVNEAAGAAMTRAEGQEPEPAQQPARLRVNGQTYDFAARLNRPTFDVSV